MLPDSTVDRDHAEYVRMQASLSSLDAQQWLRVLKAPAGVIENHSYYWGNDPSILTSLSEPQDFSLGTGLDIYQTSLLNALEAAEQEVLFVTCFWARSVSLSLLADSLVTLSRKAIARNNGSRICVRLCFSSASFFQKLFHTSSWDGKTYTPSNWNSQLGLPSPEKLRGLDLQVKSMFIRPFSVMHPKFMIVDRRRAFIPSSNLSWERWLECSITIQGPVVGQLVRFWAYIWGRDEFHTLSTTGQSSSLPTTDVLIPSSNDHVSRDLPLTITLLASSIPTILLPSPHHSSFLLSMSPLIPFLGSPGPPSTPLNTFLLNLFTAATSSINIVSPNLTCPEVIDALQDANARGVDVAITTNRRMMLLEQLLTAGTITEYEVWKMGRKYRRLRRQCHFRVHRAQDEELAIINDECSIRTIGKMTIDYFHSCHNENRKEPVNCHIKCTVVDEEVIVLGSGNMDRASFYTSQELGVALYGKELVGKIWNRIQKILEGRVEEYLS